MSRSKVPEDVNKRFESLLREYIVVGGMPEVVAAFVKNKDFGEVQSIQEKILAAYDDDIALHAKGGIYENLISDMLVKRGYSLNYYKTDNSTMEIEFIIEKNGEVVPIEVKAGNSSSPSLNRFIMIIGWRNSRAVLLRRKAARR